MKIANFHITILKIFWDSVILTHPVYIYTGCPKNALLDIVCSNRYKYI